jgi:hypothetical protein
MLDKILYIVDNDGLLHLRQFLLIPNRIIEFMDLRSLYNEELNPMPVKFKSLLHGQEDCVFFSGHLNNFSMVILC